MARVRGVTSASRASASGRKPRSGRSPYRTGTAWRSWTTIAKLGQPGSGMSTSSPAETTEDRARCSACIPPAVMTTCSVGTWMPLRSASLADSASRSSPTPAFGTYRVRPCAYASSAAARTCGGVGKLGSPTCRPMTGSARRHAMSMIARMPERGIRSALGAMDGIRPP